MNDYSQVTKGQRVARRPRSNVRQEASYGVSSLIATQHPAAHRPQINLPVTVLPHAVPAGQSPARRRPVYSTGTENAERLNTKAFVEPPPPPQQTEPRSKPASLPNLPPSVPQPIKEAVACFVQFVLPKIMLGALFFGAAGFFTYNALLWQSGEYKVQPVKDTNISSRMLDYAAGGTKAIEPVVSGETGANGEPSAGAERALRPSEPFSWQYYTVKRGDSISKIAQFYSLSLDAIVASNKIRAARELREGDVLKIPNMDGIPYTIRASDNYHRISEKFGVPLDAILDANDIQSGDIKSGEQVFIPGAKMPASELKQVLGENFIYPLSGRLSSFFGWRKDPFTGVRAYHKGIDLVADTGTAVKAAMAGKISMVGFSPILGKYIIITHDSTYQTMYAHLNSANVARGAKVTQGETIGEVGNTGYSTGPHLHFVIYKNGREINPLEQLKL